MIRRLLAAGALAAALAVSAAASTQLIGTWKGVGGQHSLTVNSDGTLVFNGNQLRYQAQGNLLAVMGAQGGGYYQFQIQGDQLVVAGADIGRLQFQRAAAGTPAKAGSGSAGTPSAPGFSGGQTAPTMPTMPTGPSMPTAPSMPTMPAGPGAPPAPAAPGEFVAEAYGFRMKPGAGWKWKMTDQAVIFGHQTIAGLMLVTVKDDDFTEAEVQQVSKVGYTEAPNIDLKPVTPGVYQKVKTGQGMGFYLRVKGTLQGSKVQGFLGAFQPPGGQAIITLAVAAPEKAGPLEKAARAAFDSVRLFKGQSPAVRKWDQKLRGYKVTYMWSYTSMDATGGGGGTSVNKDWHLCRDGSYWYTGSSNLSVDTGNSGGGAWVTGSSHGKGNEQGRWKIVPEGTDGAAIVFQPVNGGSYRYSIYKKRKYASSYMQTYFGDMKVFAAEYAQCN